MFCTKCGKRIPDDSAYCPYCGAATAASDNPFGDGASRSRGNTGGVNGNSGQNCGAPYTDGSRGDGGRKSDDASSFGWGLLGFLIPIAGLILYLVWKDEYPLRAKSAGKGALSAVILYVLLVILYIVLIAVIAGSAYAAATVVVQGVNLPSEIIFA